ncbi:MAG: hypothetical protein QOD99_553 [Chthoniobacter sp.]|jgi:D-alanyl-D-alanine carboxypeptidase (penicillin-binding protein 5/6)|nr:hypothetical protein [Chthoniobacter sp.]
MKPACQCVRAAALLAFAILLNFSQRASAQEAAAFVVTDSTTGHILLSSNSGKKLQIGSLTKIATAVVVLDWLEQRKGDISQPATVPPETPQVAGQNPIGFEPGDMVSVRDLLYAALMQSDNAAALTLADHVGRSLTTGKGGEVPPVTLFVAQMNALARRLEMKNTLFVNPHGIDANERKLPYSTAADLAKLTAYAMAKPAFRFCVSQKERTIGVRHAGGAEAHYMLRNTNELLGTEGIDGVKTGTTQRAGECVILSSSRSPESIQEGTKYTITPRRLVVVVLGSSARFQTGASLLHQGWGAYDQWTAAGRPLERSSSR